MKHYCYSNYLTQVFILYHQNWPIVQAFKLQGSNLENEGYLGNHSITQSKKEHYIRTLAGLPWKPLNYTK